jgi:hypothetical protein
VRVAAGSVSPIIVYKDDLPLEVQLADTAVVIVRPNGHGDDREYMASVIASLQGSSAVGLFLLPPGAEGTRRMLSEQRGQFLWADEGISPPELAVQLRAAMAVQPRLNKLHSELSVVRIKSDQASHTLEEVDEQMRLAARLQRDFLPRRLPEVGPARFGVLYRPATWVSGDIYDVVRLDETHVGFYVADVVGHGMPAALLTMFIKKAMQTKRIVGQTYEIVSPDVSLRELNADICEQHLPSCQFCTAVYCVLDTDSLILTHARGGHPEPVVVHPGGKMERLWVDGSLLGIFPDEQFEASRFQLARGDRVLLYTDGAEPLLSLDPASQRTRSDEPFSNWVNLAREELLLMLSAAADDEGRVRPDEKDDVTVLVLDIE